MDLIRQLLKYWTSAKVNISPPVSVRDIEEFESSNTVSLPEDFRRYLLAANGLVDRDSDACMISFWSLNEIEPIIHEDQEVEVYFKFADFLIDSHHYAMKLKPSSALDLGSIWALAGPHKTKVANTFQDFLKLYLMPYTGEFGNIILELKW